MAMIVSVMVSLVMMLMVMRMGGADGNDEAHDADPVVFQGCECGRCRLLVARSLHLVQLAPFMTTYDCL